MIPLITEPLASSMVAEPRLVARVLVGVPVTIIWFALSAREF